MAVVHTPQSLGVGVGTSSCKNLCNHSCLWSQEVSLQSGQFQTVPVPGCLTPALRSLGDLHTTPLADASTLAVGVFNEFKGVGGSTSPVTVGAVNHKLLVIGRKATVLMRGL